ncbi:hypothetical protein FOC4_g10000044 [Fusarium odoratissimum]|uniref:NmrA-like domain-containing protein n=2 Tax=Fusarium oxysporum f. sp. cubense (strain race 4) TaxID=2502994 RepID=N1RRT3_FUSC4|nr:hypothetical protein FOC4_g10000044 [Fusarium odoratissimum]
MVTSAPINLHQNSHGSVLVTALRETVLQAFANQFEEDQPSLLQDKPTSRSESFQAFMRKVDSITALTMDPSSPEAKELQSMGAKVVQHVLGCQREVTKVIKDTGCDTICLIPPAHPSKFDISAELVNAAAMSNVANVCLINPLGCNYAGPQRQPQLQEFIDLESLTLSAKGNFATQLGHSPVVIRAGFYADNLLFYAPQAQKDGILPLQIGTGHKFAPVALGAIAAHVLTGKGQHGFDDKHRGQMMVVTGLMLCAGEELATAASQALGVKMEFENISETEARKVLCAQSESDDSE